MKNGSRRQYNSRLRRAAGYSHALRLQGHIMPLGPNNALPAARAQLGNYYKKGLQRGGGGGTAIERVLQRTAFVTRDSGNHAISGQQKHSNFCNSPKKINR